MFHFTLLSLLLCILAYTCQWVSYNDYSQLEERPRTNQVIVFYSSSLVLATYFYLFYFHLICYLPKSVDILHDIRKQKRQVYNKVTISAQNSEDITPNLITPRYRHHEYG